MTTLRILAVPLLFAASATAAAACPFCEAPSLTLTEQINQSDAAALVQWVESKPANRDKGFVGSTTYELVDVVRDSGGGLKPGARVTLDRDRAAKPGDLFVLLGTRGNTIEWSSPLEVTETGFNYMKQAPTRETNPTERLKYFLKFLEYPDPLISNDAYSEFANAPYKDIVPLKDVMPREKIRKWLTDKNTPATRLGLYGLMIGLCGNADDAELMKQKIMEPTQDFRLGIDGIMAGYLLLTGEKGLDELDRSKLRNTEVPFSETYAAMQALRFLWTYAPERVEKDRLRKSMRELLVRPELTDLVIIDLTRWEDWSIADRLMEMYDAEQFNVPSIKRAIVRYYLVAERAKADSEAAQLPEYARKAKQYLAQLREEDPKTVQAAERFFFVN
jgi:hypothetical protein